MILKTCNIETLIKRCANKDIICFGAGNFLDHNYIWREFNLQDYIVSFIDNNSEKWGSYKKTNSKKIIINPPQYLEKAENFVLLITSGIHSAIAIYNQLQACEYLNNCECYFGDFVFRETELSYIHLNDGVPKNYKMNEKACIPKKIHYCWFGNNQIPERDKQCIESWKKFCPDYEIIQWSENNYDVTKNKYMKQAYEAKKWAFVSDYARLDIIYKYGGIYLDTDVEIVKNINDLLYNTAFCGVHFGGWVANGLGFGGIAGAEVFKEHMHLYENMDFISADGTLNLKSGPEIYTEFLEQKYGYKRNGKFQIINNMAIYPRNYFDTDDIFTEKITIFPETYSIHHYNNSWFENDKKDNNAVFKQLYKIATDNERK